MFTIETEPRVQDNDTSHQRRTWAYALDAETCRAAVRNLTLSTPSVIVFVNGTRVTV